MAPPSGAVGVSVREPVRLSFSKSMRKDDVEHAVHFFPPPPSPPRLHWDGDDLVLSPDTAWDTAQTYVVTLAGEATDVRGNRLSTTYQSAFSTGSHIDTGRITGQVLQAARPAAGVSVLCYRLPSDRANPELDSADYVVQTDAQGRFALSFLRTGSYRVFALADRDRDWLWNIGVEELGVPATDVALEEAGAMQALPVMHLAVLDTVLPTLLDCSRASAGWWALEFDLEWSQRQLDSISVFEVLGPDTTLLERAVGSGARSRRLYARTRALETTGIELVVRNARAGRPPEGCVPEVGAARDSLQAFGPVEVLPDTAHPWLCPPRVVALVFNEAVARVTDSLFSSAAGGAGFHARTGSPFEVLLDPPWASVSEVPLRCEVRRGAVVSESGALWPQTDSTWLSFPVVPADSSGEYELTIVGLPLDPAAVVIVEIWPVERRDAACPLAFSPDQLATGRLAGGNYQFSILQDRDGDRVWSPGWPVPYVPSERLWYPADTLHVRPRFTVAFTLQFVASTDTLR